MEFTAGPMNRWQAGALLFLFVGVLAGVWLAMHNRPTRLPPGSRGATDPSELERRTMSEPQPVGRANRRVTSAERKALMDAIAAARDRRAEASQKNARQREERATIEPSDGSTGRHEAPEPTYQYVRSQVRHVWPLLAECYESQLHAIPGLRGDLVMRFSVEGEPGVGGVVTHSAAIGGVLAQYPELTECIEQTMTTVAFDPPEAGGMVQIEYPFSFEPAASESTQFEVPRTAAEPSSPVPGFITPQP